MEEDELEEFGRDEDFVTCGDGGGCRWCDGGGGVGAGAGGVLGLMLARFLAFLALGHFFADSWC